MRDMELRMFLPLRMLVAFACCAAAGCAFNYPQAPDSDLFIPLIAGYSEDGSGGEFDLTQNLGSVRISRALEQEYFANWLHDVNLSTCAEGGRTGLGNKETLVQITKILKPFEWEAVKENQSPFNEVPGGVLFGHGAKVEGATLLSLRFALTPLNSERYKWDSVDLPYRYLRLEDISLSDEAIGLLDDKTKIYSDPQGHNVVRDLEDEESIVLDMEKIAIDMEQKKKAGIVPGAQGWPRFLPIRATRKLNLEFSDEMTNAPIRYDYPVNQDGYIKVVNLSEFDDESDAYMSIVRSLILAQAGDCDTAFSIYRQIAGKLENETRVQMLFIIAHLHGQAGGDVSAVLAELDQLPVNEDEKKHIEAYRELNAANEANP